MDEKIETIESPTSIVTWVTFKGDRRTLPGIGETVLFDAGDDGAIVVYYRHHPVDGRTWGHFEPGAPDFQVEIGDRWAHLPTAPAEKE